MKQNEMNKEVNGSWIFEKMNADELREYLKTQIKFSEIQTEMFNNLSEKCTLLAKLAENHSDFNLLIKRVTETGIKLNHLDSAFNDKYMDEYLAESSTKSKNTNENEYDMEVELEVELDEDDN